MINLSAFSNKSSSFISYSADSCHKCIETSRQQSVYIIISRSWVFVYPVGFSRESDYRYL